MGARGDLLLSVDEAWDYDQQCSINEMVLHSCGPLFFEDAYKVLPRACHCGDLKVPNRTRAATRYWELGSIDMDYNPGQLYEFIQDEEAATKAGWNVEFVKTVIRNAVNVLDGAGRQHDWEWYQQELKNNSWTYVDDARICKLAHVFWQEFSGEVTHAIVERDSSGGQVEYLFFSLGRYANFNQCIHPMYCDRGNGGFHHSVTGLGVKMLSAMIFENRLLCNLMDGANAPKVMFKPTTAQAKEKFSIAHFGNFGLYPAGFDVTQTPIQGLLNDGLSMFRTSQDLTRSNLSQYRQPVAMEKPGNPATKYEKQMEAAQQGSLSNTTFSRFYKQLDALYAEIFRRLCDLNTTDQRAKDFQADCIKAGVPRECFGRIKSVRAVRVIGQGSPFLRKQAVQELTSIVSSFPEDGQTKWRNDFIASTAGQAAVSRYNPTAKQKPLPSDQTADAFQWVAAMKVGVIPIVTSSQNALTHAGVYLQAGIAAVNSVKQGADPATVVQFLDKCGPAIGAQLGRIANDPLRKQVFDQMEEQWHRLGKLTDELKKTVQKKMQMMKQQAAKSAQVMTDAQIAQMEAMTGIAIKGAKAKQHLDSARKRQAQQMAEARQRMALADATTASQIHRSNRMAAMGE